MCVRKDTAMYVCVYMKEKIVLCTFVRNDSDIYECNKCHLCLQEYTLLCTFVRNDSAMHLSKK